MHPEVNEIEADLTLKGYCHLKRAVSYDCFETLAKRLGEVIASADIKLAETPTKVKAYSPNEFEFHTDNDACSVAAWFCEDPGEEGEATLLIDTADLREKLSDGELSLLARVDCYCPTLDRTQRFPRPVLTLLPDREQIYYAPWHGIEPQEPELKAILSKFVAYLAEKEKKTKAIDWKRGACLFVDNKRMLHGRKAMNPKSQRHLKRLWISRSR